MSVAVGSAVAISLLSMGAVGGCAALHSFALATGCLRLGDHHGREFAQTLIERGVAALHAVTGSATQILDVYQLVPRSGTADAARRARASSRSRPLNSRLCAMRSSSCASMALCERSSSA